MAIAIPLGDPKDNFELELSRVREKIKNKFAELADCLKTRENELLRQLDNVLASYQNELGNERIIALERTNSFHQNELLTSSLKYIHENVIKEIERELKAIKTPIESKMVSFECDNNNFLAELNKLGKLVGKVQNGIDYTSKKQPLVSVCKRGNGNQQLNSPLGVTVDNKTGNIYVADQINNCIKVFDNTSKYLFKFGDNKGEGKMYHPRGVAIYGDRILITQGNHSILCYGVKGKFISRICRYGVGKSEFSYPFGLTIDESNGEVYICDSYNNRIQILSQDLSFKSQFGKDFLKQPRDVNLSKEYIYVLDESNPCLHLFDYNHLLQKSVISRGIGMRVLDAYFFNVDENGNILITDSDSIHIFTYRYLTIHTIYTAKNPMGITTDKEGRVIVSCQANKGCLAIY